MKKKYTAVIFTVFIASAFLLVMNTGCGVYKFNETGEVPDSVKTIRVQLFDNNAPYVNTQLAPTLTDRFRQKLNNQTGVKQTNNDNADWDITGNITEYTVTTSGITSADGRSQTSINRLTVSVSVTVKDRRSEDPVKQVTATRQFDFGASQSLQQAEAGLLDEMVRNLSDEIFNRLFSDW